MTHESQVWKTKTKKKKRRRTILTAQILQKRQT